MLCLTVTTLMEGSRSTYLRLRICVLSPHPPTSTATTSGNDTLVEHFSLLVLISFHGNHPHTQRALQSVVFAAYSALLRRDLQFLCSDLFAEARLLWLSWQCVQQSVTLEAL